MPKCTYCNSEIKKGTGLLFAQNDGRMLWFDRKKCEKNMFKLRRKASSLKWTLKND